LNGNIGGAARQKFRKVGFIRRTEQNLSIAAYAKPGLLRQWRIRAQPTAHGG
jgi:hypothetical protein